MKINKKFFISLLCVFVVLTVLAGTLIGCNRQLIDTTYSFEKCIISLPNGEVIEAEVDSWRDYNDGDQIQVKIDEKVYLVHSSDIVLISE